MLSERMHSVANNWRKLVDEGNASAELLAAAYRIDIEAIEVAALEARLSKMDGDVRHMKRWASGFNVQVNPQVVLDAVVRMCDDALGRRE
jgi:hypothetical protein